jgi:hypothetical protein
MDFMMLGMNPTSSDMRLVLTWGPNPSDFDSEVKFFDIDGNLICRTYYGSPSSCVQPGTNVTYMHLDVDETNGGTNGPETISVPNIPDGVTAMYYIYDYSQNVGMGSMSFSDSDALSTIYGPNGSGHISVALNDDKIDGGETYFIIGCFDNNGYTGFHYVGETRADSELYCPDIAWSYTTGAPLTDAPLLVYGCANPQWEGDGYCDDTNNNDVCNYDGGDCCGDNVNMNYCSACQCLDPDYTHHPTEATVVCENPQFIGDGYCDDHLNIHDCTYDGGDCCGPAVQTN